MDKYQLAQYLVNLHTLLSAQQADPVANPSKVLTDEYTRGWAELKDLIKQENEE